MSKERLEVIEAKLTMAKEDSISSFTDEFLIEMEYLIDRVKEQAEQIQKWKDIAKWQNDEKLKMEKIALEYEKQNKRYREIIEKAIYETYEEYEALWIIETLRKALEGEE